MIPQDLIQKVSKLTTIKDITLLEKDLYLQGIISELSKIDYFRKNFVFKGGTCLTKVYFDYYRFSEDLDFTWFNQKIFEKKSAKQERKIISRELEKLTKIVHDISKLFEFDFKPDKSNKKYFEFGGGNKFTTYKIYYKKTSGEESFIKIQVNFREEIIYPIKEKEIKPITLNMKERLNLEYPEYSNMLTDKSFLLVYDLREIAAEKVRAILTRKGFKVRDLIDLYKISTKRISLTSIKESAIKKTLFMLKFEKYFTNILKKKIEDEYTIGNEANLMITPLEKEYNTYTKKTIKALNLLSKEIIKKNKNK